MELLMTLPLATFAVVVAKFLAAWIFIGIALLLSLPLWATVNYLGEPDNGIVLAAYYGQLVDESGAASELPLMAPHLSRSKEPINVIVVADVDMLTDHLWVQVSNFLGQRVAVLWANNGDFVMNAVENLGGSETLISLRSRGQYVRPY